MTEQFLQALDKYVHASLANGGGTCQQRAFVSARDELKLAFDEAVDARIQDARDMERGEGVYGPQRGAKGELL